MVRTTKLSDGTSIPVMAWGNASSGLFGGGQKCIDVGVEVIRAGIRHLDTAQVYKTEHETGEAVRVSKVPRESIYVTSKLSDSSKTQCNATDVRRSVQDSLDKLGFIPNLYLLHNPLLLEDQPGKKISELYTLVEDLVLDGTLKDCSLGLSNFRPQDIEEVMAVARIKPVVNQIEFHPYVLVHLDPVMAVQEKYGILTCSYSGLSPLRSGHGPLPAVIKRIAQERGIDEATVYYLWQLGKGIVIVTSSSNPDHIRNLPEVENMEPLTKAQMDDIEQAGRSIHWRRSDHMTKDFPPPNLPNGGVESK